MGSTLGMSTSARLSREAAVQLVLRNARVRPSRAIRCAPAAYRSPAAWLPLRAASSTASSSAAKLPTTPNQTSANSSGPSSRLASTPFLTLFRSYLVWTLTSIPVLVDNSPKLLNTFLNSPIPGVGPVTEAIIRRTFFKQFIPGETTHECLPALEEMRRRNVGSALNYNAEADSNEGMNKVKETDPGLARYEEMQRAFDLQGDFERRMAEEGWARGSSGYALKITGMIDPPVLIRASNTLHRLRSKHLAAHPDDIAAGVAYPGVPLNVDALVLSPDSPDMRELAELKGDVPAMSVLESELGLQEGDLEQLKLLWDRLDSLAQRAQTNGIRMIIDAEECCYQPALDGYTLLLSLKYNKPPSPEMKDAAPWTGPIVYGTYQSYLARQPAYLAASLKHAKEHGYALGLKVVRGGYIVQEARAWKAAGKPGPGPVWVDKPSTDKSYNGSVETIVKAMKEELDSDHPELAPSVIFGTHNNESVERLIASLESNGLATRTESGKLQLRKDVEGKIGVAQLYGMKEDLSDVIMSSFEPSKTPISLNFVAYGRLREVMPFLGRRAVENKSVMSGEGGAASERRRVGKELRRRLSFGLLG